MGSSVEEVEIFSHAETFFSFQIDVVYAEMATFFAVQITCNFN